MSDNPIIIKVVGDAAPAGSKTAAMRGGFAFVRDASKKTAPWKAHVAACAQQQYRGPLLDGPLSVSFLFKRRRSTSHFGTGRNKGVLKASAPAYPISTPDLTKLVRCTEDALKGIVWTDDCRIIDQHNHKEYCKTLDERPGVTVIISAVE